MSINNPEVFPHPASQIEGITLFDMIILSILSNPEYTEISRTGLLFDAAKEILNLRNIAIQNLDNYKTMSQIMKEIEDNEYNEKHM